MVNNVNLSVTDSGTLGRHRRLNDSPIIKDLRAAIAAADAGNLSASHSRFVVAIWDKSQAVPGTRSR